MTQPDHLPEARENAQRTYDRRRARKYADGLALIPPNRWDDTTRQIVCTLATIAAPSRIDPVIAQVFDDPFDGTPADAVIDIGTPRLFTWDDTPEEVGRVERNSGEHPKIDLDELRSEMANTAPAVRWADGVACGHGTITRDCEWCNPAAAPGHARPVHDNGGIIMHDHLPEPHPLPICEQRDECAMDPACQAYGWCQDPPCQPIGCDAGIHLPGCTYAAPCGQPCGQTDCEVRCAREHA